MAAAPKQDNRPVAELDIVAHGRAVSYRVTVAGKLIWATRAYATDAGRAGARERLRAWSHEAGYRLELKAE